MIEHTPPISRRKALAAVLGTLAPLAGCGGGGVGVAGLSSGGTGTFTTGTVSGLGSIIVNGVRFDIAQARVQRDGVTDARSLQPGMVVAIAGSQLSSTAGVGGFVQATALEVQYGSEWTGPVEQIGTDTLTLLGSEVDILDTTVFDGRGVRTDWRDLRAGDCVEVFGWLDLAQSRLQATRIELLPQQPPEYRFSGVLGQVDTARRTSEVGNIPIFGPSFAASWRGGDWVNLRLDPAQVNGQWLATRVEARGSAAFALRLQSAERTALEGTVTSITAPDSFSVNGLPVVVQGTPVPVQMGEFVRVQGALSAAQVLAERVQVIDRTSLAAEPFVFLGRVEALTLAGQNGSFVLQGQEFSVTPSTQVSVPAWTSGAAPQARVEAAFTAGRWIAQAIAPLS